jgi:hypothetical protein
VLYKHFLEFSNLFLRWKIFRKILSYPIWAEPVGSTRSASVQPAWPARAHPGPAAKAGLAKPSLPHGTRVVHARRDRKRPYKGEG